MISVILPVYNVEDYIEECLDSLLNQTIGEENLEVILVDDASTDNSVDKIKSYKNKFTNLVLYQYQKNNGSPGKPRNKGVSLATGEFIHFMDPDDVLYENTYEILLKNIKEKVLYFLDVRSASVHNMTQVFEWYSPICTTASLPWGGVQSYVLCKESTCSPPPSQLSEGCYEALNPTQTPPGPSSNPRSGRWRSRWREYPTRHLEQCSRSLSAAPP